MNKQKNKTNFNSTAIEKFIKHYDNAVQSRSKEMRVDMELAGQLASSLSVLLSQQAKKDEEIQALQKQLIELYEDVRLMKTQSTQTESNQEDYIDAGGFSNG